MIQLNYRDARPIYEQVKDGLRHLVVTGALQAGDKLPSVTPTGGRGCWSSSTPRRRSFCSWA